MEDGYYTDLCEAIHNLADELDHLPCPLSPEEIASKLRELAGIDTRGTW